MSTPEVGVQPKVYEQAAERAEESVKTQGPAPEVGVRPEESVKTQPAPVYARAEESVKTQPAPIPQQNPPIELALIVNAITTGFKNLVKATTTSSNNLVNSLKNDVTKTINKINTNSILKTMAASIEQINGSMPAPAETNNAAAVNNATAGGGTRKAYHRKGLRVKKGKKTLRNRRT